MAVTMSTFDAVLKDFYEGTIREQLNNEVPAFKLFDESDRQWSGRRVQYPIHTGRNNGVGARSEGGTLPTGGNQTHVAVNVTSTYYYGRIRLSGQTIQASKTAFAEALATEMKGVMNDAKVDLGRITWGTGDGRLAELGASAAADASSISVFNRFYEPGQPGARYIGDGMALDIGTVANPTAHGSAVSANRSVISSNPATTVDTITTSGSHAQNSACGVFLFNAGAGGKGVEALGLQALVDDITAANYWDTIGFYGSSITGVDRGAVSAFNALVFGNSGTARLIDGNLLQQVFDEINIQTGEHADLIMGHHSVIRAFLDSVASDRRYVSNGAAPRYDAGFSNLSYNGVPLEYDRLAPYNTLLVCKKSVIKKFTLKPIGFADADHPGSILDRVAGQDNWDAWLCTYFNMGLDGPVKATAMIRDIKTDL